MPANILNIDTAFPQFEAHDTVEMKLGKVMNYLYMLLEQLRYTLENLGAGNFNEAELDSLTHLITDPVMARLTDMEGNMASLDINASGITSRLMNAEGHISTLQQTADGLSSRVSTAEGNISTFQQTANGLSSRVTTAEGNISTFQQTADGLSSRVSTAEGNITTLTQSALQIASAVGDANNNISQVSQTADKIEWLVASGDKYSNFTLTSRAIRQVSENITLDADQINLNGDTTLQATNGDNDLVTEISGNAITLYCDPTSSESESLSRILFRVNTNNQNKDAAQIFLKNYGSGADDDARYALVLDAGSVTHNGNRYWAAVKLQSEQAISAEAYKQIYLHAYGQDVGSITLDAETAVAIRPGMNYDDASALYGSDGYLFCTDGIYLDGRRIA